MTIIIVGNEQQKTSIIPTESTDAHGHEAEDVVDVGKLDISSGEIDTLDCTTLKITGGAELTLDAALGFKPVDANNQPIVNALYTFGRNPDYGEQVAGLLDGITMNRILENEDQELYMQLHPSVPNIDIYGTREANVPWMRITDSSDNRLVFAIHDDGTLETPGWSSGILPDAYHESLAIQPSSLYIGKCKISEYNHQLHVQHLKVPPYIPIRLTQSPYSFTTSNINANITRSVNDWVKLARSVLSITAGKAIRINDVFPTANTVDWDDSGLAYTHGLTSDAQVQIDALSGSTGRIPDIFYIGKRSDSYTADGTI